MCSFLTCDQMTMCIEPETQHFDRCFGKLVIRERKGTTLLASAFVYLQELIEVYIVFEIHSSSGHP